MLIYGNLYGNLYGDVVSIKPRASSTEHRAPSIDHRSSCLSCYQRRFSVSPEFVFGDFLGLRGGSIAPIRAL